MSAVVERDHSLTELVLWSPLAWLWQWFRRAKHIIDVLHYASTVVGDLKVLFNNMVSYTSLPSRASIDYQTYSTRSGYSVLVTRRIVVIAAVDLVRTGSGLKVLGELTPRRQ